MDKKILGVKGFNILLILLIAAQLVLLIATSVFFIYPFVQGELELTSVMGFVGLIFVCLPICIYTIMANEDRLTKKIFFCLSLTILSLTVSGIIWYIIPVSFKSQLFAPIGMLFMAISYIPLIVVLYQTYKEQQTKLPRIIKLLIVYVNAAFILTIMYFVMTNIPADSLMVYNTLIYTLSLIGDVIILSFTTGLIILSLPTKMRYLYSIIFGLFIFSFIGDSLNLLENLSLILIAGYTQYTYDFMLIFLTVTLIIYVFSNIKTTTIEEVNKKLEDTTLVVDDMITQAPDPICMCDADGRIIKANDAYLKLFQLEKENALQKIDIFHYPFGFSADIQPFLNRLKEGESVLIESIELENSGSKRYLSLKLYPTYSSDGKITSYIFNAEDITERKHAEYMLKNAYEILEEKVKERTRELSVLNNALNNEIAEHKIDEEKIKASLKEKEVLLKEIHHRVKNNMQIISSMLGLQTASVDDPRFNEMMKDSQNRIRSMALIHENLYRSENMAEVDFSEYVSSLVSNINVSYRHNANIRLSIDIENISLDIDTAIPLGLMMNELITNSFKHAFPQNRSGEITIKLSKLDNNRFRLLVRDDGVGLPKDLEINNSKSLGLQLVNILIEQIEGSLKVDATNGVCYTIEFPNR